jgi:FixJ family two-component response regulator
MSALTPVSASTSSSAMSSSRAQPYAYDTGSSAKTIALLDPLWSTRARTWKILKGLRLPAAPFDRASDLLSCYVSGQQFGMLVVSFAGSNASARTELDLLCRLAGAQTPIALLMQPNQVELATHVMGSERNDFLLLPASDDELQQRLSRLHAMWGVKPADWYQNETVPPMTRRS